MPVITTLVSVLLATSSARLRLLRIAVSSSAKTAPVRRAGGMLISMLNCASSVWKSGSAIISRTWALFIAGSPLSSVRFSSISRPMLRRSLSNRDSASILAKTSRQRRTFSR